MQVNTNRPRNRQEATLLLPTTDKGRYNTIHSDTDTCLPLAYTLNTFRLLPSPVPPSVCPSFLSPLHSPFLSLLFIILFFIYSLNLHHNGKSAIMETEHATDTKSTNISACSGYAEEEEIGLVWLGTIKGEIHIIGTTVLLYVFNTYCVYGVWSICVYPYIIIKY